MGRRRKMGFSFSWKRASGLSAAKGKVSRKIGVPLSKSGRQRKAGKLIGCALSLGAFLMVVASLLAVVGSALADDERKIQAHLEQRRLFEVQKRSRAIERLDSEIKELRKDPDKKAVRLDLAEKQKRMTSLKAELGILKKNQGGKVGRFSMPAVGRVGYLDAPLKEIQVKGPDEFIAEIPQLRVVGNAVVGETGKTTGVCIRGFSTGKLTTDSMTALPGIVVVSGTTSYATVLGGTRTVFVVERFDLDKAEAALAAEKKEFDDAAP